MLFLYCYQIKTILPYNHHKKRKISLMFNIIFLNAIILYLNNNITFKLILSSRYSQNSQSHVHTKKYKRKELSDLET